MSAAQFLDEREGNEKQRWPQLTVRVGWRLDPLDLLARFKLQPIWTDRLDTDERGWTAAEPRTYPADRLAPPRSLPTSVNL